MNEYRDVHASLLRFIATFCEEMGPAGYSLTPLNLDAFATPTEWPPGDFIGLAEFRLDTDGRFVDVTTAFVVSTKEDINLRRMEVITDLLLNRLIPPGHIDIVHAITGATRGRLHVVGSTRAGSVQATKSQPALPIMVRLKADQLMRQA